MKRTGFGAGTETGAGTGTEAGTGTKTGDVSRQLSPRELGQQRAALTAILEAPSGAAAEREFDAATRFDGLTRAEKRAMAKRQRPEPEPASDEDEEEEDDEVVIARAQKDVRAKRATPEDTKPETEPEPKKKKVGLIGNTNARRNPNNPRSGHAGVIWIAREGKWRGTVQNKLEKTASGKVKHEYTANFPEDQVEACVQAQEALRARLDGEYKAEMDRRAAADPLTRGLPRGPDDAADAEEDTVYWRPNQMNDHMPCRWVRGLKGRKDWIWRRACVECASHAEGSTDYCIAHGGGKRCQHTDEVTGAPCGKSALGKTGYCVVHGGGFRCEVPDAHSGEPVPPNATFRLSADASLRLGNGQTQLRPEYAGLRCCMSCLKSLDPTNVAVTLCVRKEHLVVSAIAQELNKRGRGDLVWGINAVARHDCATGPSLRRADLEFRFAERFILIFENDEDQHKRPDYTTSCHHAKLAGHLADRGAPAFTKEEDALWDPPHPPDHALEALKDTDRDTLAMRELRAKRKKATTRVIRDYSARSRAAGRSDGGVVVAPKLCVLQWNCDAFVAADGTKVGSLTHHTGTKARKDGKDDRDFMAIKPTKRFPAAISLLVDEILELERLNKEDDSWFDGLKELTVVYRRYDGCDAQTGQGRPVE